MHQAIDSSRLDAMAVQLARLERANRWWRRSAAFALLAITMIGLTAQVMPPSRVLEIEQLVLRDASGRIRVALSALDDESIVLTFRDRLERDRLAIGLLPEGAPLMSLYDEHRRRRAAFGMVDTHAPGLMLFGEDGTSRARLALEGDAPRFVGQSADGTVLWEMPRVAQ
ncbi:MAG: hypothetical protein Q8S13_01965 [Dehalococcoidia bacterium]|nr:hypothetical protein [Dehalococcoidia bacterium]